MGAILDRRSSLIAAPYIIVGYSVADGPDAHGIESDIKGELSSIGPVRSLPGPDDTYLIEVSKSQMHKCLEDLANFFVNMNQAHGHVIDWFAQLSDQAWIGMEP